ncbi:hypothetical protein ACFY2H_18210 [Streptomyces griseofuscus]|uniref:Uncharacterized protein n=1 Tax=Streptomyces griseofuscus TaxID=146922 RepID=A0A7H1PWF0_9ACTN|nr:hypothetical protein HEP81_02054 [Streptomyces griseofuscus]
MHADRPTTDTARERRALAGHPAQAEVNRHAGLPLSALPRPLREQEQADSRSNPALNPLIVRPQERSARITAS